MHNLTSNHGVVSPLGGVHFSYTILQWMCNAFLMYVCVLCVLCISVFFRFVLFSNSCLAIWSRMFCSFQRIPCLLSITKISYAYWLRNVLLSIIYTSSFYSLGFFMCVCVHFLFILTFNAVGGVLTNFPCGKYFWSLINKRMQMV